MYKYFDKKILTSMNKSCSPFLNTTSKRQEECLMFPVSASNATVTDHMTHALDCRWHRT